MNYLVIDTENSGAQRNKAHPFDPRNKCCLLGLRSSSYVHILDIEYSPTPYGDHVRYAQERVNNCDLVAGFNLKYDLHWLRRYGIEIPPEVALWDCQLAEFILTRQQNAYPSLEDAAQERSVSLKSGILQAYLDMNLDIPDVPLPELIEYLKGDLISTEGILLKQIELIEKGGYSSLFDLQMEDLRVLADMEWNGMKYDLEKSVALGQETLQAEQELEAELNQIVGDLPFVINWNSPDQLSCILYGGEISYVEKEEIGVYKTGPRIGQPKFRNVLRAREFDRLLEPRDKDKLAKEGYWSTAEDVLKDLKADGKAREIIQRILTLAGLNKLRTGYYEGIPRKFVEKGWEDGIVHGQINQCVAITGRTSSSDPNMQNQSTESKECFITRFDN